jgi:hypothetical protein
VSPENQRCDRAVAAKTKGENRIHINKFLGAMCIGVLAILLDRPEHKVSSWIIGQLAIAVPRLFTSSLAYSKVCYRDVRELGMWDGLGWLMHSIGYLSTLNAITLMLYAAKYRGIAWLLFLAVVIVFTCYTGMAILADWTRLKEKSFKYISYIVLIGLGCSVPLLLTGV